MHTRQRSRLRYVDFANARVSMWAGQQSPMQHIPQFNVIDEDWFACYQLDSIDFALWLAHDVQPHRPPGTRKGHHYIFARIGDGRCLFTLLTAQACGGTHDGLYRFDVARAAAQVARESITHLLFDWVRIPLQQGIG